MGSGNEESGSGIFGHEFCGGILYDSTDHLSDRPASCKSEEDAGVSDGDSVCHYLFFHGSQCRLESLWYLDCRLY